MSGGVNSWTHDPICIGDYEPDPPEKIQCELCSRVFEDEDDVEPYDGYDSVCYECINQEKQDR